MRRALTNLFQSMSLRMDPSEELGTPWAQAMDRGRQTAAAPQRAGDRIGNTMSPRGPNDDDDDDDDAEDEDSTPNQMTTSSRRSSENPTNRGSGDCPRWCQGHAPWPVGQK